MMYPDARKVQNLVEKPTSILERMIALYNTKFTFDTTEVCLVKYWNSCDLIELCSDIQWAIEEEIKNNSSSSNPAKRKTICSRLKPFLSRTSKSE